MFDKPFATLFGVALFVWIGMILLESTPSARLEVACSPVRWGGNIMGSLAALSDSERLIEKVGVGTDEVDYGCQFTLWRLIYGKDYSQAKAGKSVPVNKEEPSMGGVLPPGGMLGSEREQEFIENTTQKSSGGNVKLIDRSENNKDK